MRNGILSTRLNKLAVCDICGEKISKSECLLQGDVNTLLCHSVDCRFVVKQSQNIPALLRDSWVGFQRNIIRERHARTRQKKQHEATVRKYEYRQSQELLVERLADNEIIQLDEIEILNLPRGKSKMVSLGSQRKTGYLGHLKSIIFEARNYNSISDVPHNESTAAYTRLDVREEQFRKNPALKVLCDRACGFCKGGCCNQGGDDAFHSVLSIRKIMDDYTELTNEDLLRMYEKLLPSRSIEGSCINQLDTGCALPRNMRSIVCNSFYCEALVEWKREKLTTGDYKKLFLVQRNYTCWDRFDKEVGREITDSLLLDEKGNSVEFDSVL